MAWPANQSIEHPVGANVYGSAVVRTEPDRALAEIGVVRVAATAKAAFSETGKAVEAVVSRQVCPPQQHRAGGSGDLPRRTHDSARGLWAGTEIRRLSRSGDVPDSHRPP